MTLLISLGIGLVAGLLAGTVIKHGYGTIGTIIVGMLGGLVGGWVFGLLGITSGGSIIAQIVTATIGAVILLWVLSKVKKA